MAAAGIIYKAAATVVNMVNGDNFEQAVARTTPDQEVQAALAAGGGLLVVAAAPALINQAVDTVKTGVNSAKTFINGLFADPPVPVVAPGTGGDLSNFSNGSLNSQTQNGYTVAYETDLPQSSYPGFDRPVHNNFANKALLDDLNSDPEFEANMNKIIPDVRTQISGGKGAWSSPKGWTWHHDAYNTGVMQLVPTSEHTSEALQWLFHPGGKGGFALWAK